MGRGNSKRNGNGGIRAGSAGNGAAPAPNANVQNNGANPLQLSGSDADIQAQFAAMDDATLNNFMQNLPSRQDMRAQGLNDNELQRAVSALGMNEKPTVLDNATWDNEVKTNALDGVYLWRGVSGSGSMSASDVSNHMRSNDSTFIGDGVHGDGLYFTTQFSYARMYSDGTANSITKAFIDKTKARVTTESSIRSKQRKESNPTLRYMDISTYALYKGYNVIKAPGGNGSTPHSAGGQDFYVALSRSVLTIRDTSR